MTTPLPNPTPSWLTRCWRIAVVVAAVLVVVAGGRRLGLADRVEELRVWIESLGVWGPATYVAVYAVLVTLAVPASPLTVLAGGMFGSVVGVAVVSLGSTLGAVVSMLAARYLLRDAMTRRFESNARFRRLTALTESQGAVIVAAIRLIPVFPFAALNYAFGLTRVRLTTYTFWSWLCMLPMTVIMVVSGDAVATTVGEGGVPWPRIITVVGMAAVMAVLVRTARRKLRDAG